MSCNRRLGCIPAPTPTSSTRWWRFAFSSATATAPMPAIAIRAETALFLDRNSPQFMGGFLEMANARLYRFWDDLPEGAAHRNPQNEIKHTGAPMFAELYSKPERLEQFMDAMSGISAGNFQAFAEKFDFSRYRTLCDVGGATGQLSMFVARRHPHMTCVSADLPEATRSPSGRSRPRNWRIASPPAPLISSRSRCRRPTSSRWA